MKSSSDLTEHININNWKKFSMIELAQLLLLLVASTSKTVFMSLQQDDPRQKSLIFPWPTQS